MGIYAWSPAEESKDGGHVSVADVINLNLAH